MIALYTNAQTVVGQDVDTEGAALNDSKESVARDVDAWWSFGAVQWLVSAAASYYPPTGWRASGVTVRVDLGSPPADMWNARRVRATPTGGNRRRAFGGRPNEKSR